MAPRLATEPEMLTENTGATAVGDHTERRNDPTTERQTMRALRIVAPRRIEIQEIEIPEPGPGQVRVRIHGCGVCGSELSLWQGQPWFEYPAAPGAPGHEGWGAVDKCGSQVKNVSLGEQVAFVSTHAYAEYDVADAAALVPIPPGHSIFPGEALGCAVNAFQRGAIEKDQTVAVIGTGFMGALLIQLAASAGARVIALSRRPFALDIGRRCGARETVIVDNAEEVAALVMQLTGGTGCERVIEAAGAQETLDLAGALIAVRGRLVIVGYHQDSNRVVNLKLWNWRGIDVINAHEHDPAMRTRGMSTAARLIGSGLIDPACLYTHAFALDDAAEAFTALETRPEGFLKGWIRTNDEID